MKLWQKIGIGALAAGGIVSGIAYMNGSGKKDVPIPIAAPEKKVTEPFVPEPILQAPKEVPKEVPKEEPKPEPPKYEPKPVEYTARAVFENPVAYAIAMEKSRVETSYRKITGQLTAEGNAFIEIYDFGSESGDDDIVQHSKLGMKDLESRIETLRKKDNKEYKELDIYINRKNLSDKIEYKASISIMPENEAQEKRLIALKETHKAPKQARYLAAMFSLPANTTSRKITDERLVYVITDERLTYVETKMAEQYGGKK